MSKKIIVESNLTGVGGEYEHGPLMPIQMGLKQLRALKKQGNSPIPKELDWEIKLYEWILAQPDAEKKADLYMSRRMVPGQAMPRPKRQVVASLGWPV